MQITAPATLRYIHDRAFEGDESLCILCPKGSEAAKFARNHGIKLQYTEDTQEESAPAAKKPAAKKKATAPSSYPASTADFTMEGGTLVKYNGGGGKVVVPNGVESIGAEAFAYCDSLTEVTLPASVLQIENRAFYFCKNLTALSFTNGLLMVGAEAFAYCDGLTEITLPDSCEQIERNAFEGCSMLAGLDAPGLVELGENALLYCTALSRVTLSAKLTTIGASAFGYCTSLYDLAIPASAKEIAKTACESCYLLTLHVKKNSPAAGFAKTNGIQFVEE